MINDKTKNQIATSDHWNINSCYIRNYRYDREAIQA